MKSFKLFFLVIPAILLAFGLTNLKSQEDWKLFTNANDIKYVAQQGIYLWLATNGGGLIKFNKSTGEMQFFDKANSQLPDMVINEIKPYGVDSLWICTNNGLARFDNGEWTVYNVENSDLPSNTVYSIDIDGSGDVWIGTDKGFVLLSGNTWTVYDNANSGLPNDNVRIIRVRPTGSKWMATDIGLVRFDGATWNVYDVLNSDIPSNYVTAIKFDPMGLGAMIGTDLGFAFFAADLWSVFNTGNSNIPSNYITSITTDVSNVIWISTAQGLAYFSNSDWVPVYEVDTVAFSSDFISCLIIDADNNKWLGTNDSLNTFKDTVLKKYYINATRLPLNIVNDVKTDRAGNSWYATVQGLAKYNGYTWNYFPKTSIYDCRQIIFDRNHNLWVATDSGLAKFVVDEFEFFNVDNSGLPSNNLFCLTVDVFNNVWMGSDSGLSKFNGTIWSNYNTDNSDIPSDTVNTIIFEGQIKCWVGTPEGLAMFDGTDWIVYDTSNSDLPSNFITAIQLTANNDKWIGTLDGGLSFFPDTMFVNYDTGNSELVSDNILSLLSDLHGNLWIGTADNGLMHKFDTLWNHYDIHNSPLPVMSVTSLHMDMSHNIWGSTPGGAFVTNGQGIAPTLYIKSAEQNVCAGNTLKVVFNNLFAFSDTNIFRVELSDANGSFDNYTIIGTKASASVMGTDSIVCIIPKSLQTGLYFRVRVRASAPEVLSSDNGFDIVIRELPQPKINGKDLVCFGATEYYSTPWLPNHTYLWTAVNGDITTDSSSNVVFIQWSDSNTVGYIKLYEYNTLGCVDSATYTVQIMARPKMSISGPIRVCSDVEYIYSSDTSRNTRTWTAVGGRVINMPAYNKVKIIWSAQENGRVKLIETTPAGCVDSMFLEVSIQPTPTADISGPSELSENQTALYKTETTAIDIIKKWYVINGTIVGPDNLDSVSINWPKGGIGIVIHTQTTDAGCKDSNVFISRIFEKIDIVGIRSVCENTEELYEANKNLGAYAQWSVVGGTIQGPSTNRTCFVKWGSAGTGIVRLTQWIPNTSYRDSMDINVVINNVPPKPTITENRDTLISSAATGNQWYLNGQIMPGATQQKLYTYQVRGNYTVQATVAYKCISPMSDPYSFISSVEPFNFDDALMSVTPNPSSGLFQLNLNTEVQQDISYSIFNNLGQLLATRQLNVYGLYIENIDLSVYSDGIYHIIVRIGEKHYRNSLILQK